MLSFAGRTKFKSKLCDVFGLSLLLQVILVFAAIDTNESHSLLQSPLAANGSACGDVLCLHGTCREGKCICDKGWQGSACHKCGGRIKLTAPEGYISDGMSNYSTDLQCTWLIDSGEIGKSIRLHFVEFETECSWDHLYIFDGDSVFAPLIAAFSGLLIKNGQRFHEVPDIVASSGKAYLYFYSDAAYNMSGFNISYSINTCPKNCSGNGVCLDGICTCSGNWDGSACDIPVCPNDCNNHGHCDREINRCNCNKGYTGFNCTQEESEGYWILLDTIGSVAGRALHQSAVIKDSLYISGGESFDKNRIKSEFLVRYDFEMNKWYHLKTRIKHPISRFGHSMVAHDNALYIYGGMNSNGSVFNELWMYDIELEEMSIVIDASNLHEHCLTEYCSPLPSMGHTAVVAHNKMFVIFGYNPKYGYLNSVQEFNFRNKKWGMIVTRGALVKGGFGHSSVYDEKTDNIYVYGGYHSYGTDSILVDLLYAFDASKHSWKQLNPSHSPRYLHSAVIIDGLMYIFGGNGHNATHDSSGDKCFSPQFMTYDIECDTWLLFKDPQLSTINGVGVGRYGHTAEVYRNSMYVFGGFNGLMLNSILKYSPGDCAHFKDEHNCNETKSGFLCVWNSKQSVCESFMKSKAVPFKFGSSIKEYPPDLPPPHLSSFYSIWPQNKRCRPRNSNSTDLCPKQNTCPSCLENTYGCLWCGDSCNADHCKKAGVKGFNNSSLCEDDILTSNCDKLHNCHACHTEFHCGWQRDHKCYTFVHDTGNKTQKAMIHEDFKPNCEVPCSERTTCENCTRGPCMWCSSSHKCIESNAYAAVFPLSQCMEWTIHAHKCSSLSCSDIQSCDKCQKNPRCGWCDDGSATGVGLCLEGSAEAPYMWNGTHYNRADNACPSRHWHFTSCPECQCNGHSSCAFGSNECQKPCKHLTEGSHCQFCSAGYYGNPINGGNCTACSCNNHSVFCDRGNGKCYCSTKGIVGHHCDRCDEQNHYFGNPTEEGGTCYYNLTIDFQYTFNMSKSDDRYYTKINFMNVPIKPDIDVDFSISCSEQASVNVSIGSTSFPTRVLLERYECGSIKYRFSHDENLFGVENTTFYVHVFGFSTPFILQISFSQHRTLDLLQFFVTFSSCFLSLLIIAAVLWKIKQKYDMYRRRQQLFLELEHMASRPFAGLVVEVNSDGQPDAENSSLLKSNPTPIALEPCNSGKAAVLSLILRLPTGGLGCTPPGQTGLAIASALVSLGIMDQKFSKDCETVNAGKAAINCSVKCGYNSTGV
ncbi:attractin-like protein [Leptotrombidium deliense]|uniref:Attractin-like protein n=1 Tax=Leptotrombidium deliense TaxID=299467 RepID=A0A443SSB7_9ACAR|nr:attractin-like protein [Leptotrombidium deliense]